MSRLLQDVQFFDKYSRYDYDLGRRENWQDTVTRVVAYLLSFDKHNILTRDERQAIFDAIFNKDVMPSMRNMAMAGAAAERNNICSYNCAYGVPDDLYFFHEAVTILISGTGLGYSVESRYTRLLPALEPIRGTTQNLQFTIPDTGEGWADAIYFGIRNWFAGYGVDFDFSQIRPAGSPLRIKGGRASGPDILRESLESIELVIDRRRHYGFLRPIDVHDILCHIARCIVSGGVRRSALIALFDNNDSDMMHCKSPGYIEGNEQRYLANNSAVFENEISLQELTHFANIMFDSGAGEPGIFNRRAITKSLPARRKYTHDFGTNPCAEIVLRPFQFCNLSSVIVRPDDSLDTLFEKVEIATIIGTLQSMAEHFPGLRQVWQDNQREERLLGVDLNGIMDSPFIRNAEVLRSLRLHAVRTNIVYADKLGINQAASVTCIKPSGNSSVMLDTSPGIHARWSDFYIRRMQIHKSNPILPVLQMYGVPIEPSNHLPDTFVAAFPVKAPEGAITNGTFSAINQLENWKLFKLNWTDHNPSCTISYSEDERVEIINWLYENQGCIAGLSFLPKSDAVYEQMPYETITETEYTILVQDFPDSINWETLHALEANLGDRTNASQLSACTSNKCEV